jgi:hypothetical protein
MVEDIYSVIENSLNNCNIIKKMSDSLMKECSVCKRKLVFSSFYSGRGQCKDCYNTLQRNKRHGVNLNVVSNLKSCDNIVKKEDELGVGLIEISKNLNNRILDDKFKSDRIKFEMEISDKIGSIEKKLEEVEIEMKRMEENIQVNTSNINLIRDDLELNLKLIGEDRKNRNGLNSVIIDSIINNNKMILEMRTVVKSFIDRINDINSNNRGFIKYRNVSDYSIDLSNLKDVLVKNKLI